MIDAGNILGINVLDHVVISKRGYHSMREGGFDFSGKYRSRLGARHRFFIGSSKNTRRYI
jgi:hypothetical protein